MTALIIALSYSSYLLIYRIFLRRNGTPQAHDATISQDSINNDDHLGEVDKLAALWGLTHNKLVIEEKKELGACIYFSNNTNATGTRNGELKYRTACNIPAPPNNNDTIASIHAHPNLSNGFNWNWFSPTDKRSDEPGYLVTPMGELKRYDPNIANNVNGYFHGFRQGNTITLLGKRSLPWDTRYDNCAGLFRRIGDILDIVDWISSAVDLIKSEIGIRRDLRG